MEEGHFDEEQSAGTHVRVGFLNEAAPRVETVTRLRSVFLKHSRPQDIEICVPRMTCTILDRMPHAAAVVGQVKCTSNKRLCFSILSTMRKLPCGSWRERTCKICLHNVCSTIRLAPPSTVEISHRTVWTGDIVQK